MFPEEIQLLYVLQSINVAWKIMCETSLTGRILWYIKIFIKWMFSENSNVYHYEKRKQKATLFFQGHNIILLMEDNLICNKVVM